MRYLKFIWYRRGYLTASHEYGSDSVPARWFRRKMNQNK